MVKLCKNPETDRTPLPEKDVKSLQKHYNKKLSFYKSQNDSKWVIWSQKVIAVLRKTTKNTTQRNYKKQQHRKRRKVDGQAKQILEQVKVVVLVNEQIPSGAICVLGKGLGFITTPTTNVEDTRLDMRLLGNRVLNSS